ncbi:MAG TPA: DUF3606 domain-containing protein [Usitatibacter sp.]|jgi:hypothetical protein|nr:DUF3606 domain-containing protein [Usitatibacter sp.]
MHDRYRELLAKPTVDIRNPQEVEMWTEALDIFTADLVNAVEAVGNRSDAVLAYLHDNRPNGAGGSR